MRPAAGFELGQLGRHRFGFGFGALELSLEIASIQVSHGLPFLDGVALIEGDLLVPQPNNGVVEAYDTTRQAWVELVQGEFRGGARVIGVIGSEGALFDPRSPAAGPVKRLVYDLVTGTTVEIPRADTLGGVAYVYRSLIPVGQDGIVVGGYRSSDDGDEYVTDAWMWTARQSSAD